MLSLMYNIVPVCDFTCVYIYPKIRWRRAWQFTPLFLPGEFHAQRSLVGYSSWGHKVGHTWALTCKKMNINREFIPFTRINTKWKIDLNAK